MHANARKSVERAAKMIAQDNTELLCAFIQKTAVEKAVPEIESRLLNVRARTATTAFSSLCLQSC